ncbi:cysteine-rich receptor-like protein kinase 15 isoform X2 [Quercus robur]|uniref:cysteine-rich receptor-like protein kinase 15 isoform X2 n=1 Tax=Quercus robur TaxID=38942 RepID=UPI002161E279|nr:cysteine-rich receptor-like protein kinase 15 isoform X2 [Quercus robur]
MDKGVLSAMLFFIIPLYMPKIVAAEDSLFLFCSNDFQNYTHNSPFEYNLMHLLGLLPSRTSVTGFNSTSFGDTNKVYGEALCRGDINSTACKTCIETANKEILQCKNEEVVIYLELCQVRYSYQQFSIMVYAGKYPDRNKREKTISNEDPVHFNKVFKHLMNVLSNEAALNPSNKRMFATGEIQFSKNRTIYGLVQCTRDISDVICYNCLESAIGDLKACCYSREGGIVVSRNCNVRYQLYRFYSSSSVLVTYPSSKGKKLKIWMVAMFTCISTLVVLLGSCAVYCRLKKGTKQGNAVAVTREGELVISEELPFIDLATIRSATDEFSDSNKLGQGGFGTVYKGTLPDGKEVAVKRLSRKSWQGLEEFKNEIILITKLQHRNLVKLLGCGIEGEEKVLIYEYMPNRSLDIFIFDSKRSLQLDWETCYNIIGGIARGLLYLHEDSRLKIVHRDLKPSNILLDHDMIAKISDFGMARIFCENQNIANTRRVVGTYGYMAPEYAMEGLFSVKSDVFSFGVILLEIISRKRNNRFYLTQHASTLLAYAWRLWNEGKDLEIVDPLLMESCQTSEVQRCIQIGLLCVQEDPTDRPTMSIVVALLGSESMELSPPRQPALSVGNVVPSGLSSTAPSVNELTVSIISPQ